MKAANLRNIAIGLILIAVLAGGAWFLYDQMVKGRQKPYGDMTLPPVLSAVTATVVPEPVVGPGPMLCWVDLLTNEMKAWRMTAVVEAHKACQRVQWNPDLFWACVSENVPQDMQRHSWSIPLYSGPSGTGAQAGEIRITAGAIDDFSMQFIAQDGTAVTFVADYLMGYDGPKSYFHTVLDRQEDWTLLPKDPFPTEVWINAAGNSFAYLGGDVYEWNGKDIVFLEMQEEGIYVRDTVSTDYPNCGEEVEETPEDQFNKYTIPWSEVFDENRHLRLKQTYMIC